MQSDITSFKNPHPLSNKIARVLWAIVYRVLFRPSPWFMHGWRTFLLRCFGAKIKRAQFKPRVEIWSPWNLEIGEDVFIDYDVVLYSAYGIKIGDRVILSKGAFLCTPTHDHRVADFPLTGGRITLGSDVWIAAEAFVAPGVTIHDGAVVGARAMVTRDVEPWTVVAGNPAKPIGKRELRKGAAPDEIAAIPSH